MPLPLRALLVDDESPARKEMLRLLQAHSEIQVVGEAEDVTSAASLAERESPNVVFLDVQMAESDGFALLPLLNPLPHIVFVTAHDEFAIRAFEANALDYLLKPVHPKRLAITVERLLSRPKLLPAQRLRVEEAGKLRPHDLIPLRDNGTLRIVQVQQIAWIEAEGIYTSLQLEKSTRMLMIRSIGEWENILPDELFARLDRSLIVNLGWIRGISVQDRNSTLVFFDGQDTPLSIGRTASARLRNAMRAFIPKETC